MRFQCSVRRGFFVVGCCLLRLVARGFSLIFL
jgi:hypothetical protein